MSIREKLAKKEIDDRILVQVKQDKDLMADVDAQIERDVRNGLVIDRTILIEICLKNYLQESKSSVKLVKK